MGSLLVTGSLPVNVRARLEAVSQLPPLFGDVRGCAPLPATLFILMAISARAGSTPLHGLEDDVAFVHAGRPQGSLDQQLPRSTTSLLCVALQRLGQPRHGRTVVPLFLNQNAARVEDLSAVFAELVFLRVVG